MSDITIVTAFVDIGRGDWTPDKGLPHYLQRTTDTYFERFAHMAQLDNNMVVYTTPDLVQRVMELRKEKPTVVVEFKLEEFQNVLDRIGEIQNDEAYKNLIASNQIKNPEYWCPEYVLVNWMKASFVRRAYMDNHIKTPLAAWLDFGYFRESHDMKKWSYDFDPNKIHVFSIRNIHDNRIFTDIIANNEVYITGPCIVAGANGWIHLEAAVEEFANKMMNSGLVDDDQTLLLLCTLFMPDMFEIRKLDPNNWFTVVRDYNDSLQ